jgi:hypothetical protein
VRKLVKGGREGGDQILGLDQKSKAKFEEGETNRNFITLPHEAKLRSIGLTSYKIAGVTDLLEGGVYAPQTADGWRMRIMSSP